MTDTPHVSALSDDGWAEQFADALREQRKRVEKTLAAFRARQRRAEADVEAWIERCRQSEAPRTAATEGLHELKAGSEELQRQIQERSAHVSSRVEPSGGVLDWEAEKRRILAALEAEGDEQSPPAASARIEIEEVLHRTDLLLSDKSREIAELKRLLEDQSASLGSVAVGAAAVGGILDRDAIVQEERENLRRAQAEWQEKVRSAEIEISIERAKLARERAEIEEKLRALGSIPGKSESADSLSPKTEKSPSGRWLARLGLKDPKSA
jgi:hypothetical protein